MKNPEIVTHFQNQAQACRNLGSEFTATLCEQLISLVDENTSTGRRIENWPGDAPADALALRLCGGLHSIIIANPRDPLAAIYADYNHPDYATILVRAIQTHDDKLCRWLDHPPQTNETARAAALLPGLLEIHRKSGLPLHLCEIGSSAGLILQLDRFYYQYGDKHWGDTQSPVHLAPLMRGALPDISGSLEITKRIGCDVSPIDIGDETRRARLKSYLWPDQRHRTERLNGAIKLALETPPSIVRADAADFVEQQLCDRPHNTAFALIHSVVWQYLPRQTKQRIERAITNHGENATPANPVYWLRLEGLGGKEPNAALTLDAWPNHSHSQLARACFHCNWINFR